MVPGLELDCSSGWPTRPPWESVAHEVVISDAGFGLGVASGCPQSSSKKRGRMAVAGGAPRRRPLKAWGKPRHTPTRRPITGFKIQPRRPTLRDTSSAHLARFGEPWLRTAAFIRASRLTVQDCLQTHLELSSPHQISQRRGPAALTTRAGIIVPRVARNALLLCDLTAKVTPLYRQL